MRYMVHVQVPLEVGNKLDMQGGPGPAALIQHMVERFKPEMIYISPAKRELWMVVEVSNPATIAEIMLIVSKRLETYPEFAPVVTLQEFPKMIKESMEAAAKSPEVIKVPSHA